MTTISNILIAHFEAKKSQAAHSLSEIVAGYLGQDDIDVDFKQRRIRRLFSHILSHGHNPSPPLDWTMRPTEIRYKISEAFRKICRMNESHWLFNGSYGYFLCEIEEERLLRAIIHEAYPKRKKFTLLDIGAGRFQWAKQMRDYINKNALPLPKDVSIRIISVRGENYEGNSPLNTGHCTLFNFGRFKVEELSEELRKRELYLEGEVDLIVSRWTFRHLVDPVGTFAQAFNLLRPKTGLLLMDGFFFLHEKENQNLTIHSSTPNLHMIQLLLDSEASFLMQHYNSHRSLNHIIARRDDTLACPLPMRYLGMEDTFPREQGESQCVIRFARDSEDEKGENIHLPKRSEISSTLYGSKSLFLWLQKYNLLENPFPHSHPVKWEPICT